MNAYFACHAHAHALHLCSLTRSVQCFQQLRDDGVVEQSASQSGYGAAIKHCDQPVVLKLNPFLLRNQVAELSGVESFTNAQAQHDGLFDVLVGSDAFTAGPWHIALIDGGAPQSRMRDIPGAQSFAVFAIAIMRMRTGTETGPIDVPPIAKVVLRLVSRTSPIANLIPFEAGFGEHRVGDFVFVRFVVIVRSRQRARRDPSSHFRIRRDGERICGNMVDAQIDGGADGCAPIVKTLPRAP